jgi:uncharacterized protein YkwD
MSKARFTFARIAAIALASLSGAMAHADPLATVQMLREGGCGGLVPAARPLQRVATLDRVASLWAAGESLSAATRDQGFHSGSASGVHVSGPDAAIVSNLRHSACRAVADRAFEEVGVYQRGAETWLVLATVSRAPDAPAAAVSLRGLGPAQASHVLELVNEARARGTRCGTQTFAPAPPLALSGILGGAASGHAVDMALHNYFEHVDLAGHTPADRVRAVGYQEKLVGENIAYGPETVEDVVRGWLDSPGHCANIMDPRFAEMGIAWAPGQVGRRGLYWVQVLAEPRA